MNMDLRHLLYGYVIFYFTKEQYYRNFTKFNAVEGIVYTCTATLRQPGLKGGCIDFVLSELNNPPP